MKLKAIRKRIRRRLGLEQPDKLPRWATSERLQQHARAHRDVEGFFEPRDVLIWDALLELQEARGIRGHMLEIGVYKGLSAYLSTLYARPDEHCWFVDLRMNPAFRETMAARMPKNAHFLEMSSFELRKDPEAYVEGTGAFRWIHIDGQHSALGVVNDLEIADRCLAPQGVVSVDDCLSPSWPQVAAGLFRYLHEHPGRLALFLTAYNKAYLTRPASVEAYQHFVREELAAHLRSRRFESFTIREIDLEGVDDGLHCLGIDGRFQDTDYVVTRYHVG